MNHGPQEARHSKFFLLDEAWLFNENETIAIMLVRAEKMAQAPTAMILGRNPSKRFEESGSGDSGRECPRRFSRQPGYETVTFTGSISSERPELDLIDGLVPPGQC